MKPDKCSSNMNYSYYLAGIYQENVQLPSKVTVLPEQVQQVRLLPLYHQQSLHALNKIQQSGQPSLFLDKILYAIIFLSILSFHQIPCSIKIVRKI